jgi:HPt (histidine-containing phosphotransfer) domain-containing protein
MTEDIPAGIEHQALVTLPELEAQFDPEMTKELVAAYLEDTHDVLDKMHAAIIDRDVSGLKSVSHMLKGASRIITAHPVEIIAGEMETFAIGSQWLQAESRYELLKEKFENTVDILRRYLK